MPFKDPENWSYIDIIGLVLMAVWGGFVAYILDIRKNNLKFRWKQALMQVVVSGFAGVLCMLGAMYYELPMALMGFTCGISGLAGSKILAIFEKRFISSISQ